MPDFGEGGTRDVTVYDGFETVRFGEGEYLHYHLTASGPEPRFSFACKKRELLTQFDFDDHPTEQYKWEVGTGKQISVDENDDVYSVGMLFNTNVKYNLVVERRNADDGVIKKLIDVEYASKVPEDVFFEPLRVFLG